MKFENLNIDKKILKKLNDYGIHEPTEVQEKSIPILMKGHDLIAQSETGSGKTLAFAIPILKKVEKGKGVQALIITPTRELANQIKDEFIKFGKETGLQFISVYGGVSIDPQIKGLKTSEIVVGTPGRILDHINRGTIYLGKVKFLVLDEADRMLDMGFIDDVNKIIMNTPKERQTMLFSATMPYEIQEISRKYMKSPKKVETRPQVKPENLKQVYYNVQKNEKFSLLVHLIKNETERDRTIIFCGRRNTADAIADNLRKNGINAEELHGGLSQSKREFLLSKFHKGEFKVMVATDVAARGLDIKNVTHVFNYDIPDVPDDYTHRIGRTARAGEDGIAISLLCPDDFDNFRKILANPEIKVEKAEAGRYKKIPFRINSARRFSGGGGKRGGFRPRRNSGPRRSGRRSSNRR